MNIQDLWNNIYENESVTVDVNKKFLPKLKRRLSVHKSRIVSKIGDDPGVLRNIEVEGEDVKPGEIRVRFFIADNKNNNDDLPIKIVAIDDGEEVWDE